MSGLRSSQLAEAAGVNLQTLRYYERRGLLAEPERSLGGHRLYPDDAVTVLKVIKAAQRLGFTLDEVADLLAAGGHRHGGPAAGLQDRARIKLAEVEAKIADLQVIAATLKAAVAAGCDDLVACAGQPCCPIPFAAIAVGVPDAEPR
ncbi:MerR family transcriptional regulator [Actinoplanes lobatus]|uniref:DNA-binding transcriptional MerR regulator n=1 Tax=Actinoplanes lobatus TaxID=113568 RepID=A0A7W7HKR9_9ACTN|nr:MerR family transcriptional regulator [Actinoplanes lobatus]MBB4752321.1 DNA-binding transcriptional MerR regulator [Actinoplanes lobatus]GGN94378.1 MerR family transcriptional regulator [Actinoplanes lobatus]GIE46006.1 MerR family transcriptional regulator [Actinoplanes lobatus]